MLQRTAFRAARSARVAGPNLQTYIAPRTSSPIFSELSCRSRAFTVSSRWRADDAKPESKEGAQGEKSEATPGEAGKQDAAAAKELEKKTKEVLDVTDKWKRSIADFRNLQEQTRREVTAARDFAIQRFAKDLIESIDNLDRALETVPQEKLTDENKDLKALHDGLRMTEKILMSTLKKHGLERFDPSAESEKFDPNKHEATFQVPQPDKVDGTCFHTQQKGFILNGRTLRAAKVGVVKNS
ncbi:GrpE, mitochondrial [Elsinoe australis]|uniref:GrpE protein homolog n=1 Tax=Elsinoe australis TaxID=40998 RepID=A0A2P7YJI8_9PEZI|nr:GrpE, mitochondrial [Elsinoe australis]